MHFGVPILDEDRHLRTQTQGEMQGWKGTGRAMLAERRTVDADPFESYAERQVTVPEPEGDSAPDGSARSGFDVRVPKLVRSLEVSWRVTAPTFNLESVCVCDFATAAA